MMMMMMMSNVPHSCGVINQPVDTQFSIHPEDGGSKVLRNFGIVPLHYTAS
jgi:hypothetical protein